MHDVQPAVAADTQGSIPVLCSFCPQVKSFLMPLKGVVLQTFGAGNCPNDIVKILKQATEGKLNGNKCKVLIVNITQCLMGTVSAIYAAGTVSKHELCLIIF